MDPVKKPVKKAGTQAFPAGGGEKKGSASAAWKIFLKKEIRPGEESREKRPSLSADWEGRLFPPAGAASDIFEERQEAQSMRGEVETHQLGEAGMPAAA